MNFEQLHFSDDDLVAEGRERWIYQSPRHPDLVFKLQKPIERRELKNDLKSHFLRTFPQLRYHIVRKEYRAYVSTALKELDSLQSIPVNHLYGFASSNLGLVQIAEKVSLDTETLGPTLGQLHRRDQLNDDRLALLNEFVQALLRCGIATNDISAQNIILGMRSGKEVFVAVDGFGDIHLLPLRTYSRRMQRYYLGKRLTKVARGLSLRFDPTTFTFH